MKPLTKKQLDYLLEQVDKPEMKHCKTCGRERDTFTCCADTSFSELEETEVDDLLSELY